MQINVLHVATRHRRGGARRNLLHRIDLELACGDSVHVAVGRDSDATDFGPRVTVHVIASLTRPIRPISDIRAALALRRVMVKHRIHVVHTHQSKAGIVGRAAAFRCVPVVVHTVHMAPFGQGYPRLVSRLFRLAERVCAGFTYRLIFVGRELEELFEKADIGSPDSRIVVRSPVDVAPFSSAARLSENERLAVRSRYGLEPRTPVALAAGLLERRKRFDLVVRALAPSLRAGRLQLAIAGEGPEERRLRTLLADERLPNVRLLGYVDALWELFGCADVFVHASSIEGVPQVVLQAVAAGLPVVATRAEGLAEVPGRSITVVGRDGSELEERVREMIGAPRIAVAPEAFREWSPDTVTRQLEMIHSQLRLIVRQRVSAVPSGRWL